MCSGDADHNLWYFSWVLQHHKLVISPLHVQICWNKEDQISPFIYEETLDVNEILLGILIDFLFLGMPWISVSFVKT